LKQVLKKEIISLPPFSLAWGELAFSSPILYIKLNRCVTFSKQYAKSVPVNILSNHQQRSKCEVNEINRKEERKRLSAPPHGPVAGGSPVSVDEPSVAIDTVVILRLFPIQCLITTYCWLFSLDTVHYY